MTFTKPFNDVDTPLSGIDAPIEEIATPFTGFETLSIEIEDRVESLCFEQDHLLHGVDVTVVFPCLNEEFAVGLCVTSALETMRLAGINGSVLVVDNG